MICASCGTEIPDDSIVCPSCGNDPAVAVAAVIADPAPTKEAKATIDYSRLSKAQYKDAKSAYKAARKAAGKSRGPLIIFCIILAILLAIGGAFAMWYYQKPQIADLTEANSALQEQVDKLTAENAELTQKIADLEKGTTDTKATSNTDATSPLLGTWKVDGFESTSEHYACYGGKAKQASVRVNITEVDSAKGTIVADLSVIYHGHDRSKLKADTDSSSDDVVLEYTDVKGDYADGVFTFELDVDSKYGNNSGIVVTGLISTNDAAGSALNANADPVFSLSVKSFYQSLTNSVTDTYIMKS